MLELESGSPLAARTRCEPLADVAGKLQEGSEPALAAALAALAARGAAEATSATPLDAALRGLVAADSKAMLAYVLNAAATQDLAAGDFAAVESRAAAALAAAAVVGRRSEIAVARALLGRAALARGDAAGARGHLDALADDRARPLGLSRRAAAALDDLAAAVTQATTSDSR